MNETQDSLHGFNPEEMKKRARAKNPAFDAACIKAEGTVTEYLDPLVDFFARLEAEVLEMPIAERFRRDIVPTGSDIYPGVPNPMLIGLNEAEHKRMQLRIDLNTIRQRTLSIANGLESFVMDMEATKLD